MRALGRDADAVHLSARSRPVHAPAGATFHEADLLDDGAAAALVADVRPTHLLHLAWVATPATYRDAAENAEWVHASRELIEAFAAAGGTRCVVAGTCGEYDWSAPGPYRERESPTAPESRYGRAKDELRRWLEQAEPGLGLSAAWARLFFLYGPKEPAVRFVPSVATALLRGEPAECTEGTQVRDYLHVDDAARALLALLWSDVEGPVNVASGSGVQVRELAARIAATVGATELLRIGAKPTPAWEPAAIVGDVARLHDEVRWRPRVSLDAGLAETVEWWRARELAA
jgi:nucleoside-diphosphate-sugar epimerase